MNNNRKTVKQANRMATRVLKKAGLMTLAATTVSGTAFGVAASNTIVLADAPTEESVAATVEQAQQQADAAKQNYDAVSADLYTASNELTQAEANSAQAQQNYEDAQAVAQQAFNDLETAVSEAKETAEADWQTAQENVVTAGNDLAAAETNASEAKETYENSVQDYNDAVAGTNVTQADIDRATEVYNANAETEAQARQTVIEKQEAVDSAKATTENADLQVTDAGIARDNALADNQAANEAVENAQAQVDAAQKDIDTFDAVAADPSLLQQTDEYKAEQDAKAVMNDAGIAKDNATTAFNDAQTDYEGKVEATENAQAYYDDKESIRDTAGEALTEAENALTVSEQNQATAQKDYDDKNAGAKDAAQNLADAQTAKTQADEALTTAKTNEELAKSALEQAQQNVVIAKNNATNEQDALIAEKQTAIDTAIATKEQLTAALPGMQEQYNLGSYGFINWMLTTKAPNLTPAQIDDLNLAKKIIEDATKENMADSVENAPLYSGYLESERGNSNVIVIGDQKDATDLINTAQTLQWMKDLDEKRVSDSNFGGYNPIYTNFAFMASAQAGAMRAAEYRNHSDYFFGENEGIAFGQYDPMNGWYTREKQIFDALKEELGLEGHLTDEQYYAVEDLAMQRGQVIGHYTGLFTGKNQVFGFGFTNYDKWFETGTSEYTSSVVDFDTEGNPSAYYAKPNGGYEPSPTAVYTTGEFTDLYNEYYATVDVMAQNAKITEAEGQAQVAANEKKELEDNRQNVIDAAEANAAVENKVEEKTLAVQDASADVSAKTQDVTDKENAVTQATMDKEAADALLEEARGILENINGEVSANAETVKTCISNLTEAQNNLQTADEALTAAKAAEDAAKAVMDEKAIALEDAKEALDTATAEYEAAKEKLDSLTDPSTREKLVATKSEKDDALTEAQNVQTDKASALAEAEQNLNSAEQTLADAQTKEREAKDALITATEDYNTAKSNAQASEDYLNGLEEEYAPVVQAADKMNAAFGALETAKQEVTDAEAALTEAKRILDECTARKNVTAEEFNTVMSLLSDITTDSVIDNEKYDYLNEYTANVRGSREAMEAMSKAVNDAQTKVDGLKQDKDKAYSDYLTATAELATAKTEQAKLQQEKEAAEKARAEQEAQKQRAAEEQTRAQQNANSGSTNSGGSSGTSAQTVTPQLVLNRSLANGSNGSDVLQAQKMLADLGYYNGTLDGDFGPYTLSAVTKFQEDFGLYVDGVIGNQTAGALNKYAVPQTQNVSTSPTFNADLRFGSVGGAVSLLQQKLAELGFNPGPVDGYFGRLTENAVKAFQTAYGLYVDGYVGPYTNAELNNSQARPSVAITRALGYGATGSDVARLQQRLLDLGYPTGPVDGDFGDMTLNAVMEFQGDNGLYIDGIAGPITLNALGLAR